MPLYYSYSKEIVKPRYNPLDSDLRLDEALDATTDQQERDSIENIAVTRTTNSNFSISNMRWGLKSKRHPMPYDPANFSFSYSHAHRYTSGKTTVYEKEDQWRGALNYAYSPVYKTWEPFKKMKGNQKWQNFHRAFGLNYLPQSIAFNTEITRSYYELQERDMENLDNHSLPLTFNSQFLWNRDFALRWDFTKNLHFNFQSATHAEIEEPYTPVNKDLYPDRYSAWKDSVWHSIKNLGTPLDYQQQITASYQLPLNKLPYLEWVNSDATYNARYTWVRGTKRNDGVSLGNTINSNRNLNINGSFNLETVYHYFPFLKKADERYRRGNRTSMASMTSRTRDARNTSQARNASQASPLTPDEEKLPLHKNAYQREVTLRPDTTITVAHNKNARRLVVTARTKDGQPYRIKYKVIDANKILIKNLDTVQVKLSIVAKPSSENEWWYKPTQAVASFLMMVRSINVSYRNQYSMLLPGFLPMVGDIFGQNADGLLKPGLDFAFGLIGDNYIDKALENNWLIKKDDIATPATVNSVNDLQIRAVLEPIRDLKIDLNASWTDNRARSIQYMYAGKPTTHSGSFNMTTISLKGSLAGIGDATNDYASSTFDHFRSLIPEFRDRVQAQYADAPQKHQDVNPYSADVMVPAFLSAYTMGAGKSLTIFPAITRMLPNWSVRYTGLSRIPWVSEHLKSLTLSHAYKSVYSVGGYASYSAWQEYMNGLGFIKDQMTGGLMPSSMYNVSTVSINEAFSPLFGVDATFLNNLSAKLEYRTTRVLSLSMTSVQINEALSRDWVLGMGYKIQDFRLFTDGFSRKVKKTQKRSKSPSNSSSASSASQASSSSSKSGVNHDLNLRLDISFRKQAAITRDIASGMSSASSGNSAFKLSFMADYTLSRLMTITAYYDQQTNTPLLANSSYPTTTRDFGLSLKFSLTR